MWPSASDPLTGTRVLNALNQVTSAATGGGAPIAYDDNGNLTNDTTRSYSYDLGNRLTSSDTAPVSSAITMVYDQLDRLFQVSIAGGATTRYVYDDAAISAEFSTAGGVFLTTLVAFFFVEIGDKTQVVTSLLAAQFQSILWVTAGTTLGMMIGNVPAVIFGEAIVKRVPLHIVRWTAAAVFAVIGAWIVVDAI